MTVALVASHTRTCTHAHAHAHPLKNRILAIFLQTHFTAELSVLSASLLEQNGGGKSLHLTARAEPEHKDESPAGGEPGRVRAG